MTAEENRRTEGVAASKEFGGSAIDINTSPSFVGANITKRSVRTLRTLDEILVEAAKRACSVVGSVPFDDLGPLCTDATEKLLSIQNDVRKTAGLRALPSLHTVQPVQAAILLNAAFSIREVVPNGTRTDDGLGLLAIYQDEGEFEGIYRRADLGLLDRLASTLRPSGDERWHKEVEHSLRRMVMKAPELEDKDMLALQDCWYNYATGERLPFSPERVTLAKFATRLPEQAPPVPRIVNKDGSTWDAQEWLREVLPDDDTRMLVHQIIGMCLRPGVGWRVMVYLKGVGLNGKGTLLELIRQIVGIHLTTSIPPSKFGDQFALSPAVGMRLNLVDEDDVGKRVENGATLKQVISRDPVSIDRKHKDPISVVLRMSILVSLNETQQHRDKTEAMSDRQVYIEFPERFTGGNKNDAIKDDYVTRAEVREWFVYQALVVLPRYYKLTESRTSQEAKTRALLESDKVLAFHDEFAQRFERDFVPFEMLYQLFVAHERRTNPRGSVEAMRTFTSRMKKYMDPAEWIVPTGGDGKDKELGYAKDKDKELGLGQWIVGREPVLAEFDHLEDVANWDWDSYGGGGGRLTPWMAKKRKARGFVRRTAWEAYLSTGTTPYSTAHETP
jgi:putative DNA primase/helicase